MVVGGGIQGCLVALQACEQGHDIVLVDASDLLVGRASLWNEGKLHLGYIYAADRSLRSAEMMVNGSFEFIGRLERLTGTRIQDSAISRPFTYLVDRGSLLQVEELRAHYETCDSLIRERHNRTEWRYPGYKGGPTVRQLSHAEVGEIAGDWCQAAFETVEVSIDPHVVARDVRAAVETSSIETVLGVRADSFERVRDGWILRCDGSDLGVFDHVVNATWEDRLRLDDGVDVRPERPVLHRYKTAIHHTGPAAAHLPSVTVVLGPYGDVVSFGDRAYLSWYPVGRIGSSTEISPPDFAAMLTEDHRVRILNRTVDALAERLPSVEAVEGLLRDRSASAMEGGYVVAWGNADVDQPDSELHERFDIGLTEAGNYHSVDTGKYCTSAAISDRVAARLESV